MRVYIRTGRNTGISTGLIGAIIVAAGLYVAVRYAWERTQR